MVLASSISSVLILSSVATWLQGFRGRGCRRVCRRGVTGKHLQKGSIANARSEEVDERAASTNARGGLASDTRRSHPQVDDRTRCPSGSFVCPAGVGIGH